MNLRELASNNDQVLSTIPSDDRTDGETINVLGLTWNKKYDTIGLKQIKTLKDNTYTKRSVQKQVAAIFDSLGLFSPVTLRGKLLLQTLLIKHPEWGDSLDENEIKIWLSIRKDLNVISDERIQRCVSLKICDKVKNYLVCFCDASTKAFAAIVYLIQISGIERRSELMFNKTRLAPITATTIPRLELMGVLIGVRCIEFVQNQLDVPIENIHLFTDSQCVLKWISSTKQLSVYVSNRIREIKSHEDISFHYVSTNDNAADVASRGCSIEKLSGNKLWWNGPEWLTKPTSEWYFGTDYIDTNDENDQSDVREEEKMLLSDESNEITSEYFPVTAPFEMDYENYSSLTKLFTVTATAKRLIQKLKKENLNNSSLSQEEIESAEQLWTLHIQKKNFKDVFQSFTRNQKNNLKTQLGVLLIATGCFVAKVVLKMQV